MLWVWFCFLFSTTEVCLFCFAPIWKMGFFCFCCPNVGCDKLEYRATISSRTAGAENQGCGYLIEDGGNPCWFGAEGVLSVPVLYHTAAGKICSPVFG